MRKIKQNSVFETKKKLKVRSISLKKQRNKKMIEKLRKTWINSNFKTKDEFLSEFPDIPKRKNGNLTEHMFEIVWNTNKNREIKKP